MLEASARKLEAYITNFRRQHDVKSNWFEEYEVVLIIRPNRLHDFNDAHLIVML